MGKMKEKNKKDEIVIMMISFFISEMIENGIATDKEISYYFNEQNDKRFKIMIKEYKEIALITRSKSIKKIKELKDLIDTILNFSFFKEECPLNFGFENNTNEDKSQSIFYENEWCENNCNDNYKDCWLKYFKKLQELEKGIDSNGQ